MDVRNVATVDPKVAHNGTTPVWSIVAAGSMRDVTAGGSLELVNEFEVPGGGRVEPHSHPTHEFYYVLFGRGEMIVSDERRLVGPGDLIYIPPNSVHSLVASNEHAAIRCFCFAIAVPGAGQVDYR
jgi:quercetin dioxygenase-like cupin family protein